ncbi:hypothetical protein GE061_012564 [Apolygus lucorum]|uniref:SCP domain-containing protein n=1 Tax=Apolygus lucorum TaxID=248454 RepID=A0A8S9XVD7_APOLU|nr:hypothetical protein GE061_012564 [Apolygus lucorum]
MMSIHYQKTARFLLAMAFMKSMVESEFPDARDHTANIEEVKCVGVVENVNTKTKCQGTFLTQKHLATSCRCIGDTDKTTGIFTQGSPDSYNVMSWSKGSSGETQKAAQLHFHYNCGIEPNKVLMDLGLVETAGPFSENAVVPADLPDAQLFRFYAYIYRLQILQTRCMSTSLDLTPGSVLNMTVRSNIDCPRKLICVGKNRTNCELITLQTNYICAVPTPSITPTTPSPSPDPTSGPTDVPPTAPPVHAPCKASAGAPLLCHQMLVGINGRSADCNDPYNSYMFVTNSGRWKMFPRWVCILIVLHLVVLMAADVDWCNLECGRGLLHTMCGFEGRSSRRQCRNMRNTMTPSKRADLLHWHNSYRNKFAEGKLRVQGNPIEGVANMRQMTYYDDLETIAQTWAQQCVPAHDVCRTTPRFQGGVGFNSGQNFGTQKSDLGIPRDETTWYNFLQWIDERKNVPQAQLNSYGSITGHQPESWSHWTQLIWANTFTLGCAEVVYEVEAQFERTTFCNYGPGGNLRGRRALRFGPPCSACPRGTSCRPDSEYPSLCAFPNDPKFRQNFIILCSGDQCGERTPVLPEDEFMDAEEGDKLYEDHMEPGRHERKNPKAGFRKHVEPGRHEPILRKHKEPGRHELEPEEHIEPGKHEMALPEKHKKLGSYKLTGKEHLEPGEHEPKLLEHEEPGEHEDIRLREKKKRPKVLYGGRAVGDDIAAAAGKAAAPAAGAAAGAAAEKVAPSAAPGIAAAAKAAVNKVISQVKSGFGSGTNNSSPQNVSLQGVNKVGQEDPHADGAATTHTSGCKLKSTIPDKRLTGLTIVVTSLAYLQKYQ